MKIKKTYELNWSDFDSVIVQMSEDILKGYHCVDAKFYESRPTIEIKPEQVSFTLVKETE